MKKTGGGAGGVRTGPHTNEMAPAPVPFRLPALAASMESSLGPRAAGQRADEGCVRREAPPAVPSASACCPLTHRFLRVVSCTRSSRIQLLRRDRTRLRSRVRVPLRSLSVCGTAMCVLAVADLAAARLVCAHNWTGHIQVVTLAGRWRVSWPRTARCEAQRHGPHLCGRPHVN